MIGRGSTCPWICSTDRDMAIETLYHHDLTCSSLCNLGGGQMCQPVIYRQGPKFLLATDQPHLSWASHSQNSTAQHSTRVRPPTVAKWLLSLSTVTSGVKSSRFAFPLQLAWIYCPLVKTNESRWSRVGRIHNFPIPCWGPFTYSPYYASPHL